MSSELSVDRTIEPFVYGVWWLRCPRGTLPFALQPTKGEYMKAEDVGNVTVAGDGTQGSKTASQIA